MISVYSRAVQPLPYSLEDRAGTEDRQLAGEGRTGEVGVRDIRNTIRNRN